MGQQFDWYVVRASGLVAWGIVTASVIWGLLLSAKRTRRPRPSWVLDLHRFLGGLTFVFIAVHLGALWLDSYVEFGPLEMLVPMASSWRPGAVAWGVVALYLLLAVELTSLLVDRLPRRLWHLVHLNAYAVFALTTVHALRSGADAAHPLMQAFAIASSAIVVVLTVYRVGVRARARRRRQLLQERLAAHPRDVAASAAPAVRDVEEAIAGVVRAAAAARALEGAERNLLAAAPPTDTTVRRHGAC